MQIRLPSKIIFLKTFFSVERSEDPMDLLLQDDDESGFELSDFDLNPTMRVSEEMTSSLSQDAASGFGTTMDDLISGSRDSLPNVEELVKFNYFKNFIKVFYTANHFYISL